MDVTASPPLRTAYTFAGREFDSESGYYYFRARYYDPQSGRFLQRDPEPGKLEAPETFANAYAYVANNPVNISDPTGESFWDDLFDFVVGIVVGIAAVFTGGAVR